MFGTGIILNSRWCYELASLTGLHDRTQGLLRLLVGDLNQAREYIEYSGQMRKPVLT